MTSPHHFAKRDAALFAATVFTTPSLLFQLQPLISKLITADAAGAEREALLPQSRRHDHCLAPRLDPGGLGEEHGRWSAWLSSQFGKFYDFALPDTVLNDQALLRTGVSACPLTEARRTG